MMWRKTETLEAGGTHTPHDRGRVFKVFDAGVEVHLKVHVIFAVWIEQRGWRQEVVHWVVVHFGEIHGLDIGVIVFGSWSKSDLAMTR